MVSETALDLLLPTEVNWIFTQLFLYVSVAFHGPPTNSFRPNTFATVFNITERISGSYQQ